METPYKLVDLGTLTLTEAISREIHNNRHYAWAEGEAVGRNSRDEIVDELVDAANIARNVLSDIDDGEPISSSERQVIMVTLWAAIAKARGG